MPTEIDEAIKRQWDAQNVGDTVTGGISDGFGIARPSYPYCIFSQVANTLHLRSSKSEFQENGRQFSVFGGTKAQVANAMKAIKDAFGDHRTGVNLRMDGGAGEIVSMVWESELIVAEDRDRYVGNIVYGLKRRLER